MDLDVRPFLYIYKRKSKLNDKKSAMPLSIKWYEWFALQAQQTFINK